MLYFQNSAVVIFLGSTRKQCLQCVTKVYSHVNKASPKSWSFPFRIFHHTAAAAAAALAATLGFPLIERKLQCSLPAWISISLSNSTLLYLFAWRQNVPPVLSSLRLLRNTDAVQIMLVWIIALNYTEWINRCVLDVSSLWPISLPELCFSSDCDVGIF